MRVRFPRRRLERALLLTLERNDPMRFLFIMLALALLSAAILLISPPAQVSYEAGQVADRAVRANSSVTYVSETLTEEARTRAAEAVPPEHRRNAALSAQQVTTLEFTLERAGRLRVEPQQTREARIAALQAENFTPPAAVDVVDMTFDEWIVLARDTPNLLSGVLAREIRQEDLDQVRQDVPRVVPPTWTARQRRVAAELLPRFTAVNSAPDDAATQRARQSARDKVVPISVSVVAGEVVVRDGAVVTELDVEKLQKLGLQNPGVDWKVALGRVLWSFLVATMFTLYMQRFQPEVWADLRRIGLAAGALLLSIAVSRALMPGHTLLPYFIPFAAVGMALSLLVGGRTALATQTAIAMHVGVMSGRIELVAYVLLPTLLGMAAVRRAINARDFIAAALFVALGNLGVVATFLLLEKSADVLGLLQLAAAGSGNAIASSLFAFAGVIIVGHLAQIPTVFELRELADPNHPLLRQLLLRTPGTYHHSLLVANLAERAAEVVRADPLVARVGAYYHDIGKMRNPSAFIENQAGEKNPHQELDPLVSAQIVAAHVRDGLALASRYRLPNVIREMIPGHHGTGLVKYFYQEAVARGGAPNPDAYRYPGPRPRSREAGIVMLADGVEASVRSLPAKTVDEIRRMVDKIVGDRVGEGQLDDCDLTLADIQKIKDAFVELLTGVYHERIPYPEDRIVQIPPARDATGSS
jgi:putative nucleotidyltransferase with HDIG domain